MTEQLVHTFPPIYNDQSRVLILGTFPSVMSREGNFFYHNPRNRLWKVIAIITNSVEPETIQQKEKMLLANNIAVWDVIQSCEIKGSSDISIRNVTPNDLRGILNCAPIERIFANGDKAYQLYMKYSSKYANMAITKLPSTSPANAAWTMEKLLEAWKAILI